MLADTALIERIAEATAQAKWPALVRECPQPRITYGTLDKIGGFAVPGACVTVVDKRFSPPWRCGVLVHELGHLAGLPHARKGIMKEQFEWEDIPAGCRKLAGRR